MTTKPFEEFMSEVNSMNIAEALKNAEKCLEAFEARDIIKQQQETINRQKAEIERLREEKLKVHQLIPRMIKTAKAEAVKEFAEVVVCDIDNYCEKNIKTKPFVSGVTGMEIAHNLVYKRLKEMVGEGK